MKESVQVYECKLHLGLGDLPALCGASLRVLHLLVRDGKQGVA
jgi:hypothetical protein